MHHVLSMILGSMHADMARMDRVGMNIANAQTVGYKGEVVSVLPFAAQVEQGSTPADVPRVSLEVDRRAGTLKSTGQKLDVALAGPGWFEVSTAAGVAYTRQGNFRLDAAGRLVTQQGDSVMGLAGEIQLLHGAPAIDAAGRVFEGGLPGGAPGKSQPVAQLKVALFAPDAPMQRLGDGLVRIQGDAVPLAEASVHVQQGFLENSNVSTMHEMVRLLETLRHMETLQKVATGYDEMLATSIRKLGEGA
jgi:flagellar basal-body rod protein FlgF